jgi:hypothetical protein
MGSWGAGLYQDDDAEDLRSTLALLAKLPAPGERILEILRETYHGGVDLDDDGGPTFWLVAADQFERKGIACPEVFRRALDVIETGADLRDLQRRDSSSSDLRKRAKILDALAQRLRTPRPARVRPKRSGMPPFAVEVGDVYSFRTHHHEAFNPWRPDRDYAEFKPDGWGALVVFALGRVFDWFPWCAASALTVPPSREPSLQDAVQSRFISAKQSGTYLLPARTHLKKMRMQLLGRLNLDPGKTVAAMPVHDSPLKAVLARHSFMPEARAWQRTSEGGVRVADLLAPQ